VDSHQAREILASYRPGTADAAEPQMAEALEQVKRDPELAAWFQEHCAVYQAIRAKLKSVPVPPNLKREIIAGRAYHPRVTSFAGIIPLPAQAKILLAAAAVVAITAIAWFQFNSRPAENTFFRYADRMARSVQRSGVTYMQKYATNQTDVLAYFKSKDRPTDFNLSDSLKQLPAEGGSAITWNNHPVEMICLKGNAGNLWVFVMDKKVVPDAPGAKAQFRKIGNLMTASWSNGDKTYLLAAAGTDEDLKKYLN
jgi:hypothetical protein